MLNMIYLIDLRNKYETNQSHGSLDVFWKGKFVQSTFLLLKDSFYVEASWSTEESRVYFLASELLWTFTAWYSHRKTPHRLTSTICSQVFLRIWINEWMSLKISYWNACRNRYIAVLKEVWKEFYLLNCMCALHFDTHFWQWPFLNLVYLMLKHTKPTDHLVMRLD